MPITKIKIRPGFNSQLTQTANESGWFSGNLVRWQNGLLQKVGGWLKLFSTACAGYVRALHAWEDLTNASNLTIGTDGGVQIYRNGTLSTLQANTGAASVPLTYTTIISNQTVDVVTGIMGIAVGNTLTLQMTQSIGGIIFSSGQTFTVASVVSATTGEVTFSMGINATTIGGAGGVTLTISGAAYPTITVGLKANGLSPAGTFTFDQATTVTATGTGKHSTHYTLSIPAATTVTVATAATDTFTFNGLAYFTNASLQSSYSLVVNEGDTSVNGTTQSSGTALVISSTAFATVPQQDWSLDNLGTTGLINPYGGALYAFTPPSLIVANAGLTNAPQQNNVMFTAMPQAQVILLGTQPIIGTDGQDPLLLRFSDAGSYTVWTASSINQAGSYRLSRGSVIIGGIQAPQTTLVWTDVDVWSMSYIGPPLVYGFTVMGSGCGLVAQHARCTLGRNTYWQGTNNFWVFGDTGVQPLNCPVWDIIFTNINTDSIFRCFAGANSAFNEVWFYYPSASGTPNFEPITSGNTGTPPIYSNKNRTVTAGTVVVGTEAYSALSGGGHMSGKWYGELTLTSATDITGVGVGFNIGASGEPVGFTAYSWGVLGLNPNFFHNDAFTGTFPLLATGNVFQVAWDGTAGNLWFGINNTWYGASGGASDPATGTNPSFTGVNVNSTFGQLYLQAFVASDNVTAGSVTLNDQTYTAPTGFAWWGASECDSYVKYNAAESLWDYGSLNRTAWLDDSVWGTALGADFSYNIQQHERGYDDDTIAMSNVFAETGYAEISDGDQIPFIDRCIPDMKWLGSSAGSVDLVVHSINYPGDTQRSYGPFTFNATTQQVFPRIRAREIAMRLNWAATSGFTARVGAMAFTIASAGRRP